MKRIIVIIMLFMICISLISCKENKPKETQYINKLEKSIEATKPTSTPKSPSTEAIKPTSTAIPTPTEADTTSLTIIPEKDISREQANAYLNIINDLVTKYGEGAIKSDFDTLITGLGVVRLIDFDNDGNYELYCAFSSHGSCVDTERIYSFNDDTSVLIMERGVSNPGTDVSPCTIFLSGDDKTYIWYQHEICIGSIETVEKNSMVDILTYYDDFWDDINYKLNGEPCTQEELDTAIDNFIKDKDIFQIDYYLPSDTSVITEIDNVIRLLEDKAR